MEQSFNVLLVDDEPHVTEIIGRVLAQVKHKTFAASSGDEALRVLKGQHIDLVISDILMPGMNGLELLDTIKTQYPSLPVIMLTAHGDFYVAKEALNRGAFYFLTKPFTKDVIVRVVEKALRLPRLTAEKKCVLPFAAMSLRYRIPSEYRMVPAISYQVVRACEDMEYPNEKLKFAIPLAVDELLVNAVRHGNKLDPAKTIAVEAAIDETQLVLTVEDQGEGFDPEKLPAEFSIENLLDEQGRGIMMVRYYVDELSYEKNGTRAVCRIARGLKK